MNDPDQGNFYRGDAFVPNETLVKRRMDAINQFNDLRTASRKLVENSKSISELLANLEKIKLLANDAAKKLRPN